jgi:hypothetical protein
MRFTVLAALAILGTALAAPTALTTSTATVCWKGQEPYMIDWNEKDC